MEATDFDYISKMAYFDLSPTFTHIINQSVRFGYILVEVTDFGYTMQPISVCFTPLQFLCNINVAQEGGRANAKSRHHFLSVRSLKFPIIIDGNRHSASTSILPLSQAQSSKEGVSTCLKELVNEAKTQAASQQPLSVKIGQTVCVS